MDKNKETLTIEKEEGLNLRKQFAETKEYLQRLVDAAKELNDRSPDNHYIEETKELSGQVRYKEVQLQALDTRLKEIEKLLK